MNTSSLVGDVQVPSAIRDYAKANRRIHLVGDMLDTEKTALPRATNAGVVLFKGIYYIPETDPPDNFTASLTAPNSSGIEVKSAILSRNP
jgi:hypothetical protein